MLYLGFLDKMNECIKLEQENNLNNGFNSKSIGMAVALLMALQNFAANDEESSLAFVSHPIF